MQQPEKAAAEAEAERRRTFHLIRKARIVEAKPADGGAQILELRRIDRKETAEDDGLRRLEARQRLGARPLLVGDRIADARIGDLFDLRRDEADFARPQHLRIEHLRPEDADPVDLVMGVRAHHQDLLMLLHRAVDDANHDDDAEIGIIPAIDQQRLQGRRLIALRRRQTRDDRFQHILDAEAGLGRNQHGVRRIEADHILDLLLDALGLGRRQIDLVEHRHDLMAGIERMIDIGERLRLDALARIDDEQRAFAGRERTRDFIGEVDMARRIHQVQNIGLAVFGLIFEPHRLRFDGDAALAFDIHRIEHLLDHVARRHGAGHLDQPVGQRRFAMVDMGDDGKIADIFD